MPAKGRGHDSARSANAIDEHVGRRLRKRRVSRGMSQNALAKALGIAFQQLHKYETGENRVSVSRLYQLCLILDVSVDWFFEGLAGRAMTIGHLQRDAGSDMSGDARQLVQAF